VQGRGSAANSAVCYSSELRRSIRSAWNCSLNGFSRRRGEWPDIDLDLPSGDQREKAIQYVYQRYGQFGAAMTANVITYRDRPRHGKWAKRLDSIRRPSTSFERGEQRRMARSVG